MRAKRKDPILVRILGHNNAEVPYVEGVDGNMKITVA